MKTKFLALLTIGSMLSQLTACSGGGGGGGGAVPAIGVQLASGGFTKDVTGGGGIAAGGLLTNANDYAHWQNLYLASDIKAAGKLTGIYLAYSQDMPAAVTCPNMTIRVAHTNVVDLTTTFSNNVEQGKGSMITALNYTTVTFPAGSIGDQVPIWFDTPIEYNGVDNLVIDVIRGSACSGLVYDQQQFSMPYSSLLYTNANGGSTGTTATNIQATRLFFAGGDNRIELGATASVAWPFADTTQAGYEHPRQQTLYLASEINGSGPITGIGFRTNDVTLAGTYTYSMKLGHSTKTALTTTFADNYSDTPVTVADNITFTVPANVPAGDWVWVPIPSGVFTYNGNDNLIVEEDVSAGTAKLNLGFAGLADRRLSVNDISGTETTGNLNGVVSHIALRFNGAQVTVLPSSAVDGSSPIVLGINAGQIQSLYTSTLLGTSGKITNVYVRLAPNYAVNPGDLTNYKLYMGHTAKTSYSVSDTYASNMDENAVVMSGTLTVSAGAKAGDWVKIPLTTPFAYDSTKNLSILFNTDMAASGGSRASVRYDTTRFLNHSMFSFPNSGDSSAVPQAAWGAIVDLKLDIEK